MSIRQRIDRYVTRNLVPVSEQIALQRKKIYIVPNKTGMLFMALLLILFLLAMNYGNSLVFGFTFLFAGLFLVSMVHVHRTIQGLVVASHASEDCFLGQRAEFRFLLSNPLRIDKFGLVASLGDEAFYLNHLQPGERIVGKLSTPTVKRGWFVQPKFSISSQFPVGLFTAWSWISLDAGCWVYPKPAEHTPDLPYDSDSDGTAQSRPDDEDVSGVREYKPGDPVKRISWPSLAKGQRLAVLELDSPETQTIELSWERTSGDIEQRLSVMCSWVLQCELLSLPYSLKMPGNTVEASLGAAHKMECLRLLAAHQ